MTNRELGEKLENRIHQERRMTNEVLHLIVMALDRRAYLEFGYPSMFEWLVKGFGYSHSAAFRRIEAAKLIRSVPTVTAKLEAGEVNLSTVSKVQTVIRALERIVGRPVSSEEKSAAIAKIEGQSYRETEQTLLGLYPEGAESLKQERHSVVDANTIRHSMNLSNETAANIKRAKEVLSHKFPQATDAQIFDYALSFMLDRVDPLRKKPKDPSTQLAAESASKRVTKKISAPVRRSIIQSAQGSCTYKDPHTGRTCGSRHQIQIDHIIPKAMGGSDEPENLRVRCREHNLFEAERVFGRNKMEEFRRKN